MKILHVTPAFPPASGYGGGPSVAYHICRMLVRRGHEVTVFTTDADDESSRLPQGVSAIEGIQVHVFRNVSNRIAYREKLFFAPEMLPVLKRLGGRFDLVHIHDFRTTQAVLVDYFSAGRYPYVLQAHGVISNRTGRRQRAKRIFDFLWGRRILHNAAGLIALNDDETSAYVDMGADPNRISVIPNGIDLSEYQSLPRRGLFRSQYGIAGRPMVFFLGRLHESKRIDFLLEAFADMLSDLRGAVLVVAGPDDGAFPSIRRHAIDLGLTDRVLFPGSLNSRQKMEAYVDADVFATPRFTGFPLTFLESMACGLPILTTDEGDVIREIDGKAGMITAPRKEDFRNALLRILADSSLRTRLGLGAKQLVQDYDWRVLIDRIEAFYQQARRSEL